MTYPACFVSWTAMKPEVGANPLWHGSLILSVQMDEKSPVQVIDAVGFYGITPCSDTNPLIRYIKKSSGLDIDLTGGYGELRHEEIRYLNKGVGLRGSTFHISTLQFRQLRKEISNDIKKQECAKNEAWHAIADEMYMQDEIVDKAKIALAAQDGEVNDVAIKRYLRNKAQDSSLPSEVLTRERSYAQQNDVQPRLKPFEFRFSWSPISLITFADSNTCKDVSVDLLRRILIPLKWLNELGTTSSVSSIPRFSGNANAEDFRLYSTGSYSTHTSARTGKVTKFHQWQPSLKNNHPDKTSLYWAVPPNAIVANNADLKESQQLISDLVLPESIHLALSLLVKQLQQVYELLLNSEGDNNNSKMEPLLEALNYYIQAFNVPKQNKNQQYLTKMFDEANNILSSIDLATKEKSEQTIKLDYPKTSKLLVISLLLSDNEQQLMTNYLREKVKLPDLDVLTALENEEIISPSLTI